MLADAVVVAGDRPGPDVDVGPDRRVAEVRQVVRLGPGPQGGLLQLHEVADLGALANRRPGRRCANGPTAAPSATCAPDDQAEVVDRHAVADLRVGDAHVRLDLARRPDPRLPFDDHAGVNHRVGANLDVRIDVGRGRVDERDAGRHQFFVLVLSHEPAHFRQFRAAVDAADFLRVVDHERFDRQLAPAVDGDQIGQVELALGVLRGDAAQRLEQRRQVERVDPAVDFP